MEITPVYTRPLVPPKDDLCEVLKTALPPLRDDSIIAISSKVVAISQGRCVKFSGGGNETQEKDALAAEESALYLPREAGVVGARMHTIKEGILIGSAGIDQSNGAGYFILWPQNIQQTAQELCVWIKSIRAVKRLGVIITDSQSAPLRNGATSIGIGYAGFSPLHDYRNTSDIFGRMFRAERLNVVDSLAGGAGLVMGEGSECIPAVVIEGAPHITFTDQEPTDPFMRLTIPMTQDVFASFLSNAPWRKGGGT